MSIKYVIVCLCLAVAICDAFKIKRATKLNGVTVESAPYLEEIEGQDGKFKGFIVDLLDQMAAKAGFEYSLYLVPDYRYGGIGSDGKLNGMIGEVNSSKADFAAADLTVTESREAHVDFTIPFMVNQLSALIRREDAVGMEYLEDLVRVPAGEDSTVPPGAATTPGKKLVIGSLRNGATNYFLSKSEDPVAKRLYEALEANPESNTKTIREGMDRVVEQGGYAYLMESGTAEHLAAQNCKLTVLVDKQGFYPRKYAFALPKGSPHLAMFNSAIELLISEGKVAELKQKYWANNCSVNIPEVAGAATSPATTA